MKTLWTMILLVLLLVTAVYAQTPPNPVLIKNLTTWDDNTTVTPWLNWVTRDVDDGVMYFQVWEGPSYHSLYRTDGTANGTYLFADEAFVGLWNFRFIDGIGYFLATEPVYGGEPWRSDGTPNGTYVLADLTRGISGTAGLLDFTPFNGKVYFSYGKRDKNAATYTHYLIETDGTQGGTGSVTKVPWKNYATIDVAGNNLVIEAHDLWMSDGSRQGTAELMDVCQSWPGQHCFTAPYVPFPEVYSCESAWQPLVVNGVYYNRLADEQNGDELWRSDGTVAGTYRLTDINPGAGSSWPSMLTYMDGYIYFAAYAPEIGMELWRTDGIPGHEELVADINPTGNSEPFWITCVPTANGNRLFFSADDGASGRELWISDGNPQSSPQLLEICPGSAGSDPNYAHINYPGIGGTKCADEKYALHLLLYNGKVYFAADDGTSGVELWESDGITADPVVDLNPNGGSYPHYITELNGKILFFAGTPAYGYEWYNYDPSLPVNYVSNTPPVASFTATPDNGLATLQAGFDASASYDPDGTITTYDWDFGDGNTATGITATHTYPYIGTYNVTLTVTDNDLGTGSTSLQITVTTNPPVASFTATPDNGDAPLQVVFDGSASYDPDAGGGIVSYEWDFGDGNSGSGVTATHTYQDAGTFSAMLTVTDVANGTADASLPITVTSTGGTDIFVDQQSLTRVALPGNRTAAQSAMTIKDNLGVVPGAVVYASYTGPTNGSVSGTTDAYGSVTLETASTKKNLNLDWCFSVNDIQLSGYAFNDQMGTPYACEGMPKRSLLPRASCLLHPAYPNPFGSIASTTQIQYDLRQTAHVSLRVYDALGREVETLFEGRRAAGSFQAQFSAELLPCGSYFVRLTAPQGTQIVRIVVQK